MAGLSAKYHLLLFGDLSSVANSEQTHNSKNGRLCSAASSFLLIGSQHFSFRGFTRFTFAQVYLIHRKERGEKGGVGKVR